MKIKKTSARELKDLMTNHQASQKKSAIVVDHLGLIFCVVRDGTENWMAVDASGAPEMFKSKPAAISWLMSAGIPEADIRVEVWRQNRGYIEWVEVILGNG